ncbi:hypothetical protein [Streptomyces sp. NPDC001843]|uniref:hypothetical protein n=1 Tax=Streptomyces sp. NPDC001843 TaxID=3364617 RepID=UPI0036CBAB99
MTNSVPSRTRFAESAAAATTPAGRGLVIENLDAMPDQEVALLGICIVAAPLVSTHPAPLRFE